MFSEVVGTCASLMVLLSFIMKGEANIRTLNIVGAILFVIYGLRIKAFSIWFLNGCLCIVHICRLIKIKKE